MNERIKELVEQCGFKSNPDIYDRNQSFDIPKFAELIVRECIDKIETHRIPVGNSAAGEMACEWTYSALKEIRDEIKLHFGVEQPVSESNELHTCPYAEEIHGDYDTLCDCDEERTHQCAMDI